MFADLCYYDKVLVTGPQRSGTRIAAKMIARDSGHAYVDESEFLTRDEEAFAALLAERSGIVVQCPAMCWRIEEYTDGDMLVVLMVRDLDDIAASEKRIGWKGGIYAELERYGWTSHAAVSFRRGRGSVAAVKYAHWMTRQRRQIEHHLELDYESLAAHPLWVPKERRAGFAVDQTEEGSWT
jgi:hypothetical protein